MGALCGNILELENGDGLPILAMSSQVSLKNANEYHLLNIIPNYNLDVLCFLKEFCREPASKICNRYVRPKSKEFRVFSTLCDFQLWGHTTDFYWRQGLQASNVVWKLSSLKTLILFGSFLFCLERSIGGTFQKAIKDNSKLSSVLVWKQNWNAT